MGRVGDVVVGPGVEQLGRRPGPGDGRPLRVEAEVVEDPPGHRRLGDGVLLHVQRSGDSGSPRVIGSIRFSSAGHTAGCATSYGRLPALRRTLTTSSGVAPLRASSRPLRTVLIAMPVARATAATPPQPIAPASVPDHSRRARSSIVAFNRHHFWLSSTSNG